MSPTKTFLVLVVLTVCGASAFAGGYQNNAQGARAMGMGGAYVAQASDGSAIFFNPAGLAFQGGFKVMLGTTIIMPSKTWKPTTKTVGTTTTPYTTATDMVSQTFTPINAYISYAFDNGLTVGVGVYNPFGLGSEWPVDWDGRQMSVKSNLTTWYINPTVAYRFSDQFAVGVGVSYVRASVKFSQRSPTLGSLSPLTPAATDGTVNLDGTGNSINWNVGILYKPTKDLSVGVSYRSLTKVDFTGNATFTGMNVLSSFFPGGTGTTTLPYPSSLFAGIAYNITKDFTVEADYQYVSWSSYDQLNFGLPTGPASPLGVLQKAQTLVKNWDNALVIRVGGEYRMEKLAVRAGFVYNKTPQPDAVVEPMMPDANWMAFTVGFGYDISKNVNVSGFYSMISISDRNGVITSKTALYPAIPADVFAGAYSGVTNLFGINVGLNF